MNTALPSEALEIATAGSLLQRISKSLFLEPSVARLFSRRLANGGEAHARSLPMATAHQDPTFLDWQDVREHDPAFVAANPPTRNWFNSETEYQEALLEHQERIRRGITCKTCNPS